VTVSIHERTDVFAPGVEETLPRALQGTWLLRSIVRVDAAGRVTPEPYGPSVGPAGLQR